VVADDNTLTHFDDENGSIKILISFFTSPFFLFYYFFWTDYQLLLENGYGACTFSMYFYTPPHYHLHDKGIPSRR